MDILHLVDRLEELFNESRPIPLTHNVIVDEDRMLDLIDQMRVAIPEEVKKAQQVLSQRDRIMAQSQEEANRTLSLAREKSEGLVDQSAIVEAARIRVKEIEAVNKEFDTDLHEAITKIPAPSKKLKGKVVDVVQKGYFLNDKVLRFSKVVIGE